MDAGQGDAEVVSNACETDAIRRLVLRPRAAWVHAPGQVARVSLGPDCDATFAIASAPGAPLLTFLVRAGGTAAEPIVSLERGQRVVVAGPYGAGFALPSTGRLLFAAAGTAVAAAHSGIGAALAAGHAPAQIAALIGVRTPEDLALRAELAAFAALGVDVRVVVSQPPQGACPDGLWHARIGRAHGHLDGLVVPESWVFMAGRDAFEDDLERALAEVGIDSPRVQRNYRPDSRHAAVASGVAEEIG